MSRWNELAAAIGISCIALGCGEALAQDARRSAGSGRDVAGSGRSAAGSARGVSSSVERQSAARPMVGLLHFCFDDDTLRGDADDTLRELVRRVDRAGRSFIVT